MLRLRGALPFLVLVLVAGRVQAKGGGVERIDAHLRKQAAGRERPEGRKLLGKRENLTRVSYLSGAELVHIRPQGDKANPRGRLERAVYLTARHLGMPLYVAPPIVEHDATVYGKGYLSPFIPKLRNLLDGDPTISRDVQNGWRHPERVDWDSIHAVIVLDHVTGQVDRTWNNIFIQERRGKMTAVALDNELTFGHTAGETMPVPSSPYGLLVRNTPGVGQKLSARVRRGLDAIDVAAWKADLAKTGIPAKEIEAAAQRLADVKARGLAAIFPEASRW
jgi:hypothetical protein